MKLTFVKNIQFSKLLKLNGQLKEFNFRKSNASSEGLFTIDLLDDKANRIIFYMENQNSEWVSVTPNLPKWLEDVLPQLNEIIQEEMQKHA